MTRPWRTLERVETDRGQLELRQRGESDFLIALAGRVIMNSRAQRSEVALAESACARLAGRRQPRVLIGGLGMGYTLRAALDNLPRAARVVVAELNPAVVRWCRGPLAGLTRRAVDDARVRIEVKDVTSCIARAARLGGNGRFDAILLDLYGGPRGAARREADSLYGARALERARAALASGGVLGVWSEDPDRAFEKRLSSAGFAIERRRPGRGGRRHAVYVAQLA